MEVTASTTSLTTSSLSDSDGHIQIVGTLMPESHSTHVQIIVGQDISISKTRSNHKWTESSKSGQAWVTTVHSDQWDTLAVVSQNQLAGSAPGLVKAKGDSVALGEDSGLDVVGRGTTAGSGASLVHDMDSITRGSQVLVENQLSGVVQVLGDSTEVNQVRISPRDTRLPGLGKWLRGKHLQLLGESILQGNLSLLFS